MSFKCPHCAGEIEVVKHQDVSAVKTVGRPKSDLVSGIVTATTEAIEEKVAEVDESLEAITSLQRLNSLAHGNASANSTDNLVAGFGGSMFQALKNRDKTNSAPDLGEFSNQDPEMMNKERAAAAIQHLFGSALAKGGSDDAR